MRVLALVHRHLIPPATVVEGTDITAEPWRTEYDVISTLTAMGHEVKPLGDGSCLGLGGIDGPRREDRCGIGCCAFGLGHSAVRPRLAGA